MRPELDISLALIIVIIFSGCMDDREQTPVPQNITPVIPVATITADVETGLVILNHRSGDEIPVGDLIIIIEQGDLYAIYEKIGRADDRFTKGDTLNLTLDSVRLNRIKLEARISISSSGVPATKTSISLVSNGELFARIVSPYGFFR